MTARFSINLPLLCGIICAIFCLLLAAVPVFSQEAKFPLLKKKNVILWNVVPYEAGDHSHLYAKNLEDNTIEKLTDGNYSDAAPSVKPDGTSVAFSSNRDGKSVNIYLLNTTNGKINQLTFGDAFSGFPQFSPAGNQIAYQSDREGMSAIYIIDINSGKNEKVGDFKLNMEMPCWNPTGKSLVFSTGNSPYAVGLW